MSLADWLCVGLIVAAVIFADLLAYYLRGGVPKRTPQPDQLKGLAFRHPSQDRFCVWCGADALKRQPCNQRTKHEGPPRFCNVCGAGDGEPCDAGLHS